MNKHSVHYLHMYSLWRGAMKICVYMANYTAGPNRWHCLRDLFKVSDLKLDKAMCNSSLFVGD